MVGFQSGCSSCSLVLRQKVSPSGAGVTGQIGKVGQEDLVSQWIPVTVVPGFERARSLSSLLLRTGKLCGWAFRLHWPLNS